MVNFKGNSSKIGYIRAAYKRGLKYLVRLLIFPAPSSSAHPHPLRPSIVSSLDLLGGASNATEHVAARALNKLTDKEKNAICDYIADNFNLYDTIVRSQTMFNGPHAESVTGRTSFYLATLLHRDMMRADLHDMLEQITGTRDYGVKYNQTVVKKWKIILRMLLLYRACPFEFPYMTFNQVTTLLGGSRGTAGMVQEFLLRYKVLERNPLHTGHYFLPLENRLFLDKFLVKIERKYSAFTIDQINQFAAENND